MFDLNEINKRIGQIEEEYKSGKISLSKSEEMIKEELLNYRGEDRVIPIADFVVPPEDKDNSLVSGVEELDKSFGRFHKGDIFTIIALPGGGKSAFARELAIRMADMERKSLMFAYEDTNEWFKKKLGNRFENKYAPKVLNERGLVWIEARILEAILKYGTEVVFIDNVKSITNFGSSNINNSIEISMQKLKDIAVKYNICIFLCAHIKKERADIDLTSIKDSSAIGDISSLVISLTRQEKSNITEFSIIKNRNNGRYGKFAMEFEFDEPENPNCVSGRFHKTELEELVKETKKMQL